MLSHYILDADGRTPVECDLMTWAGTDGSRRQWRVVRQVRYRRNGETWFISTVFLGLDHNFLQDGDPVLWETMVFAPDGESVFRTATDPTTRRLVGTERLTKRFAAGCLSKSGGGCRGGHADFICRFRHSAWPTFDMEGPRLEPLIGAYKGNFVLKSQRRRRNAARRDVAGDGGIPSP